MVEVILSLLILAVLICVAVWLYIAHQGDAVFEFIVEQCSPLEVERQTEEELLVAFKVPYVNKGTQDGIIMDAFSRHFLPQEQYDGVIVSTWLMGETTPRDDDYWESLIVPKGQGGAVIVKVRLIAKNGNIREALGDMVDMPVDVYYQVVARGAWYIHKARVILTADQFGRLVQESAE